ncbi:DNA-binding response regulator [Sedimentibacter sp.]|uniref:DNA-binding response regulator n=1 Tax=Sedimentibacter sp. TaxID=1960295 RepID=UPI002898EFF8|nr:DNA-binding response regulator [Sedimentibacter sp.]
MENKPSVLIVDDDFTLLKMASEILRYEYAVSCVTSGAEVLELMADDFMPDIILLDVEMPEMNGFETLQNIRKIEDAEDVPAIFLTGVNKTEAELRGFSSGAVDYITKPFVKDVLLARIRVHLENGRRLRQLSIMEKKEKNGGLDEREFERIAETLTGTEKKILRLILMGYSNQEIAQELNYTYNYVKKVIGVIYEKKYVNKRSDLIKLFR